MKKILALATFVLLMSLGAMVVHANAGTPRWVTADHVFLRANTSWYAEVTGSVTRGQEVHEWVQSSGWTYVTFSSFNSIINQWQTTSGWMPTRYLSTGLQTAQPTLHTGGNAWVSAYMLNVREGPSLENRAIHAIPRGTSVRITDTMGNSGWHSITWQIDEATNWWGTGYVVARYLTTTHPGTVAAPVAASGQTISAGQYWVTAPGMLNVRWEPNMESGIITTLSRYDRVVKEQRERSWYYVRLIGSTRFVMGWVYGGHLAPVNDFTPPPPAEAAAAATVVAPTPITPTPTAPVPTPTGISNEERLMRVVPSFLNVRAEPSMEASIRTALRQDSWVTTRPYNPEWVERDWVYVVLVGSVERVSGWAYSRLLSEW